MIRLLKYVAKHLHYHIYPLSTTWYALTFWILLTSSVLDKRFNLECMDSRVNNNMECPFLKVSPEALLVFLLLCMLHFAHGSTNPNDVAAINSLYADLGSPKIPGWVGAAGDPCGEAWQGVQCDATNNIISITLIDATLGGKLGDSLKSFSSIQSIDLSNNHISGSLPSDLPVSLKTFSLSDNNLTGSIPVSISSLTNLTALKLNHNNLTGELPDSFLSLSSLSIIDLANNTLSGDLPPSMENLSALTSLHLQSNNLSGTLDVLQNLPLQELNIENNLFSGPIPDKLQSIPNFKWDGNLFNVSASPTGSPLAPPDQPSPFFQGPPTRSTPRSGSSSGSRQKPEKQAASPSTVKEPNAQEKNQSSKTKRIVGISIASVLVFIILILALLLCVPWCLSRSKESYRTTKRHEIQPYTGLRENPMNYGKPNNQVEKAQKEVVNIKDDEQAPVQRISVVPKTQDKEGLYSQRSTTPLRKLDSDMSFSDIDYMMPPPPPPPPFLSEKVTVRPIASQESVPKPSTMPLPLTSVKSFTVASLQEYTNSFSQDNLLGSGMLGSVYRAELPNDKLLAVKKLEKGIARMKEHEFIELVNDIDRIRHVNVVELVGYCSEHGHRLLIYEYCANGSLNDALHLDDDYRNKLSWNMRTQMALGAARALEYLHEVCEPAVVHRNFKSANILLDDELSVHVSDYGLANLIASGSVGQLSGHLMSAYGYGAPEFESGIYSCQSDVYSFGVVMLELLTGRMSYDRTRIRGEQILVRWAVPQLHDIDTLQRMVDPSLNGKYPIKSLSHFADIISRCIQTEPGFRPLMSEVVQDLQYLVQRGSS